MRSVMTPQIDAALIYAAGFGTRMGALTRSTPKPLLQINNRPMICHVIERLRAGGIKNMHVNAHYLASMIEEYFALAPDIRVHVEHDYPLETGGTLRALAAQLPDVILTQNSDAMFKTGAPIATLNAAWHDGIDALLVLCPVERALSYSGKGDFFYDPEGGLHRRGDAASAPYVFSSIQLIRPSVACEIEDEVFSTNVIWDRLIAQGRIGAIVHDADWIDLGDAAALAQAQGMFGA